MCLKKLQSAVLLSPPPEKLITAPKWVTTPFSRVKEGVYVVETAPGGVRIVIHLQGQHDSNNSSISSSSSTDD